MSLFNKKTGRRRNRIRAASQSLAAVAAAVSPVAASAALVPKKSGETKIVALFGTTEENNGIGQEIYIRKTFGSKKNWRIIFVRANKFFTPELISDADLLITSRDDSVDPIDLFTGDGGLSDSVTAGAKLWTDENVTAVMDNVAKRGMGLLALHNTVMCGSRRFMDFIDVKEIDKKEFEPLWVRRINQSHPVTRGVRKFLISEDDQYGVIIKSGTTATLFETTSVHEKRQVVSGWALDRGRGRVAGLLPGSTIHAYQSPEYRTIVWNAAHWAMKRDMEAYPEAENTLYD